MRSRAGNEERKESVRAKALAFEMEKVNTDMIILFPSTRGWYKMGGKSAMFYWTYVAKSIGRRVKLRSDTDRYSTFSEGVISIKKLKLLEEKLAEVNAFPVKEGVPKGLIAFKLERPFTEEEIRQMYHTQEMLTEKINQMVRPKVTMPQLNAALYDLLKKIKSAIGQMNSWQCQAFGLPEMEQLLRLREGYMVLGDGLAAPGSTLVDMLRTSERLKNNITLAEEVSAWEKGKALKALEDLVLIDRIVREKLHIKDDRVGVPLPPREGQK